MEDKVLTTHLIGVHWANRKHDKAVGFRVIGMPAERILEFVPYDKMLSVLSYNPNGIDGLTVENGKLVGSNGQLSRYPSYINGKLDGQPRVVILGTVGDIGYEVFAPSGKVMTLRSSDALTLAKKFDIANGKVSSNNGTEFISSISGQYLVSPKTARLNASKPATKTQPQEIKPQATVAKTQLQESKPAEIKPQVPEVKEITPTMSQDEIRKALAKKMEQARQSALQKKAQESSNSSVSSENQSNLNEASSIYSNSKRIIAGGIKSQNRSNNIRVEPDGTIVNASEASEASMSVEQMIALSMLQMKNVKPFFFAALKVIPRIETDSIETIGVTPNKMYFNPQFIATLSMGELNFITLHEISHIMMKHCVRAGGRDPELWNVVCDYYINKAICDEFKVCPGSPPAKVQTNGSTVYIEFPRGGGCYNANVDVQKDTPEILYDEIANQVKQQLAAQKNSSNQNQKSQQGQGQQGGQQGGQQNQSGGNQSQQGQGQSQQGQGQQGQGQNQQGQNQGGQGQNQGQNQQGQGNSNGGWQVDISFRGEKMTIASKNSGDMMNDSESAGDSQTTREQKAQAALEKVNTVYQQVLESTSDIGNSPGGLGVVESYVKKELVPKVNWRALVQNRLIASKTDEYSLSRPDRRFVYQGVYIEGQVEEEEKLEGLKLCIDTSGSMSDKDIAMAIVQIMQLCSMYQTQADLVYWDATVQAIIPYEKLDANDLRHYDAVGRGGTDPNCIFEEFSKKEYKYGMKVPPSLIIIFTDGYVTPADSKYRRRFGQDTVWVLAGENHMPIEEFKPTFGRVATFRK